MGAHDGGDPRCGIGARLRDARERAGLTVAQAAERLHIDPSIIEALESERFDSLGAPVWVRGHLKHYAELLGESADELQESYAASGEAAHVPDLTRIPKHTGGAQRRTLATLGTAIVVAILVIGAVWWAVRAVRNTAMPLAEALIGPAQTATAEPSPPEQTVQAGDETRTEEAGAEEPVLQKVSTADPPVTPGDESPAPPSASAGPTSTLTLRFSEESWVEVYDAAGGRLFYDMGTPDSVSRVTGATPLRVVLGNAAGVAVALDGRDVAVPDSVIRGGLARFDISRGRIERSPRPAAGGPAQ